MSNVPSGVFAAKRRRMAVRYLLVTVSAITVACAPRFDRLPMAEAHHFAARHDNDVQLAVTTDTLLCECPDLIALRVAIENQSDSAAVIRYDQFALRAVGGERLPSLPLFDITEPDPMVPAYYRFPWSGFHLAPHLSAHYRGFWNATRIQAVPEGYYKEHHATLLSLTTPSGAMKRHALPEGTLEPGGYITGLLFFRYPNSRLASLIASIGGEESGRRVAQFELPIVLETR